MGRIKKKTKTKKQKITPLKNKLKKLVADYVKIRDGRVCQRCLKTIVSKNDCHASHVIPTSQSLYLRFNPINIKTLCSFCHIRWWHKDILEAYKWFEEKFPERFEFLQENRYKMVKFTIEDYKDMIKIAEEKLDEIKKDKGVL